MTPYQLSLHIQDYNDRNKQEYEDKLVLAYLGAYWQRVKKMPSIKEILNKSTAPKKAMTDEQMLARVKMLNAAFGGEVNVNGKD